MPSALVVDDDVNFGLGLAEVVTREGFTVKTAGSIKEAKAEMARAVPDVLLLDLHLPDGTGLDLVRDIEGGPPTEVVLITGQATVDTAVEAMKRGASDYLVKPVDFTRVKLVLAKVAQTRELKEQIGNLRGELRKLGRFGPLIGASPAMQRVYDLVARVANTDATVLLTGETGTGKELVAETIHSLSRRHKEPFLPINCGAVSPTLIESELFGHERGSFTGADRRRRGFFEQADGGMLFLDEITEMPAELQVKLLRVLESRAVTRVGSTEAIPVDVRVISASNRDPRQAVEDGALREDLLYRLNVFPIHLPPLRERGEDAVQLAEHFLAAVNRREATEKRWSEPALQRIRELPWPGNVRELRNVVERAAILADRMIQPDDLPAPDAGAPAPESSSEAVLRVPVGSSIAEVERRLILSTLERLGGDKKHTAEVLGISLKTLYTRLSVYAASARN
jgi:DNA-binding NtrC family response regulator